MEDHYAEQNKNCRSLHGWGAIWLVDWVDFVGFGGQDDVVTQGFFFAGISDGHHFFMI